MSIAGRLLTICIMIVLVAPFSRCSHRENARQLEIIDTIRLGTTTLGVSVVKDGLNVPWDLVWGPDDRLWFTDQDGSVYSMDAANGDLDTVLSLPDYYRKRLALASMTFHRDTKNYPYVFFNHLFLKDSVVYTRVVRYTYNKNTPASLSQPQVLFEYPGHAGHNGSRMVISPDGKLMIATGDAFVEANAQDTLSPSGKILRMNIDGSVPQDNPFATSPVWSYGFRVPQGLVYSDAGNLYSAEHGDATDDEVNLIIKGHNYGYPAVTGSCDSTLEHDFCERNNVTEPISAWTPTIAPSGMAYYGKSDIPEWKNTLLLGTLKDQSLHVLNLADDGKSVVHEQIVLGKKLGRLRDVCVSPSGDIYLSTSNRDWNPPPGFPLDSDDRIIRLFVLDESAAMEYVPDTSGTVINQNTPTLSRSPGEELYNKYCVSCHKSDGKGVEGSFPALSEAPILFGKKDPLILMVLKGSQANASKEQKYDQQMPAFGFLTDGEIAEVLRYVRHTFANNNEPIRTEDVAGVRKKAG